MENAETSINAKEVQDEAMDYEPCLQVADLRMSAADNIADASITDVPSIEQGNLQLAQNTEASQVLTSQAAELSAATTTTTALVTSAHDDTASGSLEALTDQDSSKLIMVNPMSKPLFEEDSGGSQSGQKPPKSVRQDSLVLYDASTAPKEDDHIFKVLLNNLSPATSCFCHPSVLNEKNNLDVRRCRNTFCDCRLYHCPLCTCLPNKPGRIREHFKKIHAQDLVVRYQGKKSHNCCV